MLSFQSTKRAVDLIVKSGHVPNIIGLQGIGKTDLVREFAKEKGYAFEEITCSLLQEGDLAMPYLDGSKKLQYSINTVIEDLVDRAGSGIGILLLDELNRAGEKVQSELMNLVLQRRVVGYVLPKNIKIVIAMNPNSSMKGYESTDYSVSFSDAAIMGRFISINMCPSLGDWLSYGERLVDGRSMIHPIVRGFLSQNSELFLTKEKEGIINNTPRGWSAVSDLIYEYETFGYKDDSWLLSILQGTIEESSAKRFVKYMRSYRVKIDYYKIARETLGVEDESNWNPALFTMNDAELNKVFKAMCEVVDNSEEQLNVLCKFILVATQDLAYSWVTLLNSDFRGLYDRLLAKDSFADYVIEILADIKNTEVGEFHGKQ